jgi:hypothetical protein
LKTRDRSNIETFLTHYLHIRPVPFCNTSDLSPSARPPVKLQKVERPTNRSFYVNLPAALADAVQLEKGEDHEWFIEDKNTLVLRRKNPVKALKLKY